MRRMSKSCRFSLVIMIMNSDGDGGEDSDGGGKWVVHVDEYPCTVFH